MLKLFLAITLFFFSMTMVFSSTTDTINVYSTSMNKEIKTVIILPDSYDNQQQFHVIYILHGYGDNYSTWVKNVPHIKKQSDLYNYIIVMPDGNKNSWYWDSSVDSTSRYETFVAKELVHYIDKNYKTIPNRAGRAITGNSMGGQGALFLAFRHQDIYSSVGSLSGGVDIRNFPLNWNISDKLGAFSEYHERWNNYAVINQVWRITPKSLNIIINCGLQDFFHNDNIKLHNLLMERNIPHVYIENTGQHNWKYWNNAIDYQLLFFSRVLKK